MAVGQQDLKDHDGAGELYRRAIDIAYAHLGEMHPSTVFLISNLAELLLEAGRHHIRHLPHLELIETSDDQHSEERAQIRTWLEAPP